MKVGDRVVVYKIIIENEKYYTQYLYRPTTIVKICNTNQVLLDIDDGTNYWWFEELKYIDDLFE